MRSPNKAQKKCTTCSLVPINKHNSATAKNLEDHTAPAVSKCLGARPVPPPLACQAIPPSPWGWPEGHPLSEKRNTFPLYTFL